MSFYPIVNTGRPGFRGLRIERDTRVNESTTSRNHGVPYIDSTNLPPPFIPGVGGGISWDVTTKRPYHSDGTTWLPIGSNAPGTVQSYSQIKNGDLTVNPNTATIVPLWETSSSSVYHTFSEWNLTTGIFTADEDEVITISVNLSWLGGQSNLGNRILRINHFDFDTVTTSTVKESIRQAEPDLEVDTTQEVTVNLSLSAGDRIYVEVEQSAPVAIDIRGGYYTNMSGFRVKTS